MQKFRFWAPLCLLLPLSGCDLYLPGCGGGTALELVNDQVLKPFNIETLAEVGMVTELSSDLKDRQRVCQVTIQAKADFSQRYSEAKQKIGGGKDDNVLSMLGRAVVSAALPERLESATIQYKILRDERSQGFGIVLDEDSQDHLVSLAKGYKMADIAISRIVPEGEPAPDGRDHPAGGNI